MGWVEPEHPRKRKAEYHTNNREGDNKAEKITNERANQNTTRRGKPHLKRRTSENPRGDQTNLTYRRTALIMTRENKSSKNTISALS
ncbi:hypothetical protein V6N11_012829 [Hibiscus sabdariffa]|uniref:Uncharacterized protein n=2 Tax=Hibiscus sabdariffa TaxID=183260 RepID=A0ABR2GDH2_9ROSI